MPEEDYRVIPFHPFTLGVDRQSPRTLMPEGYVAKAHNVWFERGVVRQRYGYSVRKYNNSSSPTDSPNFPTPQSVEITKAWTGESLFTLNELVTQATSGATGVVTELTASTFLAITIVSGTFVPGYDITGALATVTPTAASEIVSSDCPIIGLARFWNTSGIEVELILGIKRVYSYSYIDGSITSVFNDANGNQELACFDGSTVGIISWTLAPDGSGDPVVVFTDGYARSSTHTIYFWDGVSAHSENLPQEAITGAQIGTSYFTDLQYAKQIIYYANHMMVGNYNDNGTIRRNGVAWGNKDELGINTTTDDAGAKLLTDAKGELKRFIRLGDHLAIYFDHSIVLCDPVPTDSIYAFDTRVQGVGVLGSNAIVDIGGIHIFIGQDNFYLYDGGLQPVPIGDKVFDEFFGSVNPNSTDRIVGQHLPLKNLVIFYYPTGDNTYADAFVAFNYRDQSFTFGKKNDKITAAGTGNQTINYRCSDAPFTTEPCNGRYQYMKCSEFSIKAGFEVPTLGNSVGYLYDNADIQLTDNGATIPGFFVTDSKPLGDPYGAWGRVSDFRIESRGSTFVFSYTTDTDPETEDWNVLGSYGDHADFTTDIIPTDILAQFVAVKVEFNFHNSSTELRVISMNARPESQENLSGGN